MRPAQSRRKAAALVERGDPIQLELGSGSVAGRNGWTTVDRAPECDLFWDLLDPLPFPDNCVTHIYSSHTFEHFYLPDLRRLLQECRRVLKPSGTISVCVPNARIFLEAYFHPEGFDADRFLNYTPAYAGLGRIDVVNYVAYMAGHHRYMFDEENLLGLLKAEGFRDVQKRSYDSRLDRPEREHESVYAQAVK